MPKRIVVEEGLEPVQRYLQDQGYEVVNLNRQTPDGRYDCYVITGTDENVMGMQDLTVDVPVVDARGMTPEEVYRHVQQRTNR